MKLDLMSRIGNYQLEFSLTRIITELCSLSEMQNENNAALFILFNEEGYRMRA